MECALVSYSMNYAFRYRVLSPWPQGGVPLKTHLDSGRDGYWLDVWGSCSIYEKQEAKRGGCMIPWYPVKELLRRFGSSSGREFFLLHMDGSV